MILCTWLLKKRSKLPPVMNHSTLIPWSKMLGFSNDNIPAWHNRHWAHFLCACMVITDAYCILQYCRHYFMLKSELKSPCLFVINFCKRTWFVGYKCIQVIAAYINFTYMRGLLVLCMLLESLSAGVRSPRHGSWYAWHTIIQLSLLLCSVLWGLHVFSLYRMLSSSYGSLIWWWRAVNVAACSCEQLKA